MSKDYREQSQLEDEADEKYLTMYQYYKELTDFERGEYDALHSYAFDESEESNKEYTEGYRTGYAYAQQMGANDNG